MWAGVSALFWKNWRVKRRDSTLFKLRSKGRDRWILPPLLADVVLPISVLFYIISLLCSYNLSLTKSIPENNEGLLQGLKQTNEMLSYESVLLMTALPFTLEKANQSIWVVKNDITTEFIGYLEREYEIAKDLVIPTIRDQVVFLPKSEKTSAISHQVEELKKKLNGNESVYAIMGAESTSPDGTIQLTMSFASEPTMSLDDLSAKQGQQTDQWDMYFSRLQRQMIPSKSKKTLRFPSILPFQIAWNQFLSQRSNPTKRKVHIIDTNRYFEACLVFDDMLKLVHYRWEDMNFDFPLYIMTSAKNCQEKLGNLQVQRTLSASLIVSLKRLISFRQIGTVFDGNGDHKVKVTNVEYVPTRTSKFRTGPLESSIVFYMVYVFLWPFSRLVRDIVSENESQLKEYLLIMGLHPMSLLLSWFLLYLMALIVIVALAVGFLSGGMFAVVPSSSDSFTFLDTFRSLSSFNFAFLVLIFGISVLLLAVAITPAFQQAKTAAAGAPLIYLLLCAVPWLQSLVDSELLATSWMIRVHFQFFNAISSPVVFMNCLHRILKLLIDKQTEPGIFGGMAVSDTSVVKLQFIDRAMISEACWIMALQSIGYLVLGYYLEQVLPRPNGVRLKWYFPLQPSFWFPNGAFFGRSRSTLAKRYRTFDRAHPASAVDNDDPEGNITATVSVTSDFNHALGDTDECKTIREVPLKDTLERQNLMLIVSNLSKEYPNGTKAVKNVSFCVEKGEIFGLLGPNGAGKSTTLSVLCGLLSPTNGNAFVATSTGGIKASSINHGLDLEDSCVSVVHEPLLIRKSLSVCFQQNLIFNKLSVREHMQLVLAIKSALGISTLSLTACYNKLHQFGLTAKLDALAETLSGGQKRRLSLVLALLDDSKLVLLDEPTAGMDLHARIETWDAIRAVVTDRAVILTTHAMEEAQALCGNIGIIADGELKCCGSSLFLRQKFGVGYKLTIVHRIVPTKYTKDEERSTRHKDLPLAPSSFKASENWIRMFIPTATLVSTSKWETRYNLGHPVTGTNESDVQMEQDAFESQLILLFEELEQLKKRQLIGRYALRATDLEDVFVCVTKGEDIYNSVDADEATDDKYSTDLLSPTEDRLLSSPLDLSLWQAFYALVLKRFRITVRDKRSFVAQFVWPLMMFMMFVSMAQHLLLSLQQPMQKITTLRRSQAVSSSLLIATPAMKHNASISNKAPVDWFLEHIKRARIPLNNAESTADTVPFDIVVHWNITHPADMKSLMLSPKYTEKSFLGALYVDNEKIVNQSIPLLRTILYYNKSVVHSLPILVQQILESQCDTGSAAKGTCSMDVQIDTHKNRPPSSLKNGPIGEEELAESLTTETVMRSSGRILLAVQMMMTLSTICSFSIAAVVKEKEVGLKRIQLLHMRNRFPLLTYWLSHYFFDLTSFLAAAVIMMLELCIFFPTAFEPSILAALMVSTVLFILAIIPFLYLLSLCFSSHSSAQTVVSYLTSFQVLAVILSEILAMTPMICGPANGFFSVFHLLPLFSYGQTVFSIATMNWASIRSNCEHLSELLSQADSDEALEAMSSILSPRKTNKIISIWSWDVAYSGFMWLICCSIAYSMLFITIDMWQIYSSGSRKNLLQKCKATLYSAVGWNRYISENYTRNVEEGSLQYNSKCIEVDHVTKIYNGSKAPSVEEPVPPLNNQDSEVTSSQVIALNDVSFSVEENDCVALLGVNGSGKSTMFEILTGWLAPTSGHAYLDGIDVTMEPQQAGTRFGYCPQVNVLFDQLTVRDHCELFITLQEQATYVSIQTQSQRINRLLQSLDLIKVESTRAGELSGGNKRRLMLALSFLNVNISVLLLDEPSAGVDVVSRRLLWRVLKAKQQSSSLSCLFTTHSMEEAEAVCANAVILHLSKHAWSGSIPELKQRVAVSISITLQLDTNVIWSGACLKTHKGLIQQNRSIEHSDNKAMLQPAELESLWIKCREHRAKFNGLQVVAHVEKPEWLDRLQESTDEKSAVGDPEAKLCVDFFLKEWLVQEQILDIENLFKTVWITSHGGNPTIRSRVDLQQAAHMFHRTTVVYETTCSEAFGLAQVFSVLKKYKSQLGIEHFVVSEVSLEQMFGQLMQE
uniref:ATPbinding Cassette (ABC) Superfamily putative n=1 Tax=Albugo laibachii Nc14 TaxID=890382 RepID=F0WLE9_9STRA|nr:ATPbinding Cassette (ABC) Superfamily putative [Albugo laibachii Nc14]CCA23396.1 ATPbinding Cassette (ABC) Superfamily putative [Albugo laibachii Nc14]|eukprot:CCA23396.1 ATPbinding Cassette (ABC) Superfamily putative [Albugo laibachii Nc14]